MTRLLSLLFLACLALPAFAVDQDEERWDAVRDDLFGDRAIEKGDHLMALQAPFRASDAALVPIGVEDRRGEGDPAISRVWLIVDNNPVPLAGMFEYGPAAGSIDLSTRVRVNAYSHVRAVAETGDGSLFMVREHVRASGGCSAPVSADDQEALKDMGQIRVRAWDRGDKGGADLQIGIRHPNFSGMQMDQVTRLYRRAHYVKDVEVLADGERVVRAELTIAMSRDPSLRLASGLQGEQDVTVLANDSEGHEFREVLTISPRISDFDFSAAE